MRLCNTPVKTIVIVTSIHKDVTERLLEVNPALAVEVKNVLENNKAERHLRGGMATREKYLHAHNG